MYKDYFRLQKLPFSMTPDPRCLYMTPQHREAVAGLVYAITNRKGLLVMSGDVGSGKTTVLARVLQHLPLASVQSSVIFHPTLTSNEFLEMAMLDFGLRDIPVSKAQRLVLFQRFLLESHAQKKVSALIIDEAHKLNHELLEEVRLLGNFDYADQKLLQIVMVGQNELVETLRRQELRQLKQRIAVRVCLKPLNPGEVKGYIRYRWEQAGGGNEPPISIEAMDRITHWSKGVPRVVNLLCDQALLLAFAEQKNQVETAHIEEAARDMDLTALRPALVTQPVAVRVAPNGAAPSEPPIVGEIRVPHFGAYGRRKTSRLSRWAAKLRLA